MRTEWLALSAAALVVGATALFFGSHLTPRPVGDGHVARLVAADPDLWVTSAVVLLVAAFGMLFGISCVGALVRGRGFGVGVVAMGCIALAAVVLAGFSMQLVLLRGLTLSGAVETAALGDALRDPLQQVLLKGGFGAFYVGEVLLAWALWIAGTTPRWVPALFVVHVVAMLLVTLLDLSLLDDGPAILMVAGFAGVAIYANRADMAARHGVPHR